jgi:hypothetical protein
MPELRLTIMDRGERIMNQQYTTDQNPPIVTHLTKVALNLAPDQDDIDRLLASEPLDAAKVRAVGHLAAARAERVAAMMDLLSGLGFNFLLEKQLIACYSNELEAGEIKRTLIAAGFRDREFQIVLEYTRGWGML